MTRAVSIRAGQKRQALSATAPAGLGRQNGLLDNRPAAAAQRKLAEGIRNSPQASAHGALSMQFNASTKVLSQRREMAAMQHLHDPKEAIVQEKTESSSGSGMPEPLRVGIESLSGMDMSSVRVHANSEKPAQLNALAYAQGNEIHLGPGQERHLPHEAWHVVQQAQGRVKPTIQMKGGVQVNDDVGLETEADVMGSKALGVGKGMGQLAVNENSGIFERTTRQYGNQENSLKRLNTQPAHAVSTSMQMVKAGDYRTKEKCNLRDKNRKVIVELNADQTVIVHQGAQTASFSKSDWFSSWGVKDHTWVTVNGLQGWIRDDALQPEISSGGSFSSTGKFTSAIGFSERKTTEKSKPMKIGGLRTSSSASDDRQSILDDEFGNEQGFSQTYSEDGLMFDERSVKESKKESTISDDISDKYPVIDKIDVSEEKQKTFEGLRVYVHFTKDEYKDSIRKKGLKPGKGKGIGLPDGTGSPDRENIYVLSGSNPKNTGFVTSEAGPAAIAVISRTGGFSEDINYKFDKDGHIGAYKFAGSIPTGHSDKELLENISLVMPLDQSGRAGLARFINQDQISSEPVTDKEAEFLLARKLASQYPLEFFEYRNLLGK